MLVCLSQRAYGSHLFTSLLPALYWPELATQWRRRLCMCRYGIQLVAHAYLDMSSKFDEPLWVSEYGTSRHTVVSLVMDATRVCRTRRCTGGCHVRQWRRNDHQATSVHRATYHHQDIGVLPQGYVTRATEAPIRKKTRQEDARTRRSCVDT